MTCKDSPATGHIYDRRPPLVLPYALHPYGSTMRCQSCMLADVDSALLETGLLRSISIFSQGRMNHLSINHS